MTSIQQGDQYGVPFSITIDGDVATPAADPGAGYVHVDDARIQIGEFLAAYSAGDAQTRELSYDSTDHVFVFPLDEEISGRLGTGYVECQVAVKIENDFIYAPVQRIKVEPGIIRKKWGAGT